MANEIFDVLDISLREDSYTSLIFQALNVDQTLKRRVLEHLVGEPLAEITQEAFRGGLGADRRGDHPDLVFDVLVPSGRVRIVIECKIKSGESGSQCERYRINCEDAQCRGEIRRHRLIYLTLDGGCPSDNGWDPMTHSSLVDVIQRCDPQRQLWQHPVLGQAWSAYVARLRHYRDEHLPGLNQPLLEWLDSRRLFLTGPNRAHGLSQVLIPENWERYGSVFQAIGREQYLLFMQQPSWHTSPWSAGKRLSDCFDIHCELDIPVSFGGGEVTCHLHCETSPYMTRKQLAGLGAEAERFGRFSNLFKRHLHQRIAGTSWRASNRSLEKAQLRCPLRRTTTIRQFQQFFIPEINAIRTPVDQALEATRDAFTVEG